MKRLIPFRLLPGSWGLKGRVYEEARAERGGGGGRSRGSGRG